MPAEDSNTRQIPLTQGKYAMVDAADYDWLMQWKWHARRSRGTWYAERRVRTKAINLHKIMHREILGLTDPKIQIDHRDHDGLNNRRANLRACTDQQNRWNRNSPRTNTSGFKGVSWVKRDKIWQAKIKIGGKTIWLGGFSDKESAAAAYAQKAAELHGDFACVEVSRD